MKFIYLLLFASNFILGQTNADSLVIKNKVKEVHILSLENSTASISKYNHFGKLVYQTLDDFDGATNLKTSIDWTYDNHGKIIKTKSTHSSYDYSTTWVYDYDKRGNKIATKTDAGDLVFQYFYDKNNFLIKELAYDGDTIRRTTIYERSDDRKKIIGKNIRKNKSIGRINTTYLDDNKNTIRFESYDGNAINYVASYVYKKNKLIKIIEHTGGGYNYIYNNLGLLTKRIVFKTVNGVENEGNIDEFVYDEKD